ncbi:MAG: alpha/beta fold hydrolase [Acidimicrobiales bacterium]
MAAGLVVLALVATACSVSVDLDVPETAGSDEAEERRSDQTDPAPDGEATAPLSSPDGTGVVFDGRYAWEDAECEFSEPADVSTRCGWLDVPERWDDPDSANTIRLHVGIFSAGPTDTEPVVYLEGGPGGDALANIDQGFSTLFGELVNSHDIVIIGQRGTGSADPHLRCDNVIEISRDLLDDTTSPADQLARYEAGYVECAQEFADQGIDTAAYNSVQNAHDVEALRLALGFEKWNVLGISYGTRLGQTLMRLHPDGIRAVILDSVVPTERDPSVDNPVTAQRAFETLWAGCASSSECAGEFGDLETRFFALVDELDQRPLEFEVSDLIEGETYPAIVDGTVLMDQAFSALYSKSAFAAVPELVAQLEVGDTAGIEARVSQSVTSEPFIADGMFWSVECNEEVPFITDESVEQGMTGDPRYDRFRPEESADFLTGVCGAFDSGAAAPVENELVSSMLPVLVMGGSYDPITPPADGLAILEGLPNGFFFEYANTGHAAMADPCAQAMAVDFFANPASAPDAACIGAIEEPDWTSEPFAGIDFEPFSYDVGVFSASGLAPVGWDDLGEGAFANTENLLHTSIVLQQGFTNIPADVLLSNVGAFLDTELIQLDDLAAGGRTWSRREGSVPGSILDIFVTMDGNDTFFVLFQNSPADRDAAMAVLLDPILSAIARG